MRVDLCYLSFWIWLVLLNSCICFLENDVISSFMGSETPLCMITAFSLSIHLLALTLPMCCAWELLQLLKPYSIRYHIVQFTCNLSSSNMIFSSSVRGCV